ncbi:MAG TPA: aldehyde dehydrogenase family protein [Steroidobacteraceae bacterium]|jgi:acyl-CoA reductase-like NAD-dependent aldehyde dehydrogenase|nr:aldehyde dehydrogenase family protein [Steroidobacteraceae bacterium]
MQTISPVDGRVYLERATATPAEIDATLQRARSAQASWRSVPVADRALIMERFCRAFEARGADLAAELSWQMGRPLRYAPNEVRSTIERARHMTEIAAGALADIDVGPKPNFRRFLRREPLGVVFAVAAWNFPYLIAVNSVVPALMAGNAVVLKHSAQTPRCAERFAECFVAAGLPSGVFQVLHLEHADTERVIRDPRVDFVAFTGSVAGGRAVQRVAAERFIGVGLELGGCDPVYVREDADLPHAIENIVDGAYFNSGQSCCGLQRIYVHESIYKEFAQGCVALVQQYQLGSPLDPQTTLGPVVRASAANAIRAQIQASVQAGARPLIDERAFPQSKSGTPYLAPQLLLDAPPTSVVMREEIFGPVAGLMPVQSDEQAVALMNDNAYGLTAAIWTRDAAAGEALGDALHTGTVFLNRCDYLDPALAWVGVKDSGRGCTLSVIGYEHLTRPKSFHLRVST